MSLDKTYEPAATEAKLYERWEQSGAFNIVECGKFTGIQRRQPNRHNEELHPRRHHESTNHNSWSIILNSQFSIQTPKVNWFSVT